MEFNLNSGALSQPLPVLPSGALPLRRQLESELACCEQTVTSLKESVARSWADFKTYWHENFKSGSFWCMVSPQALRRLRQIADTLPLNNRNAVHEILSKKLRIYLTDRDAAFINGLIERHPEVFLRIQNRPVVLSSITSFCRKMTDSISSLFAELRADTKPRLKALVASGYRQFTSPNVAADIVRAAESLPECSDRVREIMDGPADIRVDQSSLATLTRMFQEAPPDLRAEFFAILEENRSVYLTEGDLSVLERHIDSIVYVEATPFIPQMALAATLRRRLRRARDPLSPTCFGPDPGIPRTSWPVLPKVNENNPKSE